MAIHPITFSYAQEREPYGDLQVPAGTTLKRLFFEKLGADANPLKYCIRVNAQPASENRLIENGDRVRFISREIE